MTKYTAALLAAITLTIVACGSDNAPEVASDTTVRETTEAPTTEAPTTTERPTTTTEAPTTTAAPVPPTAADYAIKLIVTQQHCFGSAGCNLVVVPELSVIGVNALDTAASITYQIDGGTDGPVIETIEIDATGQYGQRESQVSTATAGIVPTATITMVR